MDWWTLLAASIPLLWLLCFIDGHAVHELRLFFHALTKLAYHLYFALLQLRRAASHIIRCVINFVSFIIRCVINFVSLIFRSVSSFVRLITRCVRYFVSHAQQPPSYSPYPQHSPHQPHWRRGMLHFIEAMCVVCETVPNLMCAALTLGTALCHAMQCLVYVLAAPLRTIQACLFSQMNGEKERWDKERQCAKEREIYEFQSAGGHLGVWSRPRHFSAHQSGRDTGL